MAPTQAPQITGGNGFTSDAVFEDVTGDHERANKERENGKATISANGMAHPHMFPALLLSVAASMVDFETPAPSRAA